MAYDDALAARLRALLSDEPDVTEQRMFGGLGFLLAGTMAVAASSAGGLLLRVGPGQATETLAEEGTEPMVMRGRVMDGWVRVRADACVTDDALRGWVGLGVAAARALPPKSR